MSYARAIAAINRQPTDRIPQTEVLQHPGYMHKTSGIDPYEDTVASYFRTIELLDLDWMIGIPEKAVRFPKGQLSMDLPDGRRLTDYGISGSEWEAESPFTSPEEVLRYRPLEDAEGKVRWLLPKERQKFRGLPERDQALAGKTCLSTGNYYTTLFQYGIYAFGWENFLLAAAMDPATFDVILWQFAEISRQNVDDFTSGDCPVCFIHDDVATSRGLVFAPEWYRKYLYPKYEMILEPAKRRGKRIVYVSDGNYSEVMPDLFAVGVEGIFFDERNDLTAIIKRWGRDKIIAGNIDVQIITWGTPEDIRREVRRCCDLGRDCPGYFLKCFGDIPHNIPMENLDVYFDACRTYGRR